MSFRWQGPKRITRVVNNLVYQVTSLISNQTETVHATRICMYRTDMDSVKPSKELLSHAEHTETMYENVKYPRRVQMSGKSYKVLVEWEGLPDTCDDTWKPIENLYEDVPEMRTKYLKDEETTVTKNEISYIIKCK